MSLLQKIVSIVFFAIATGAVAQSKPIVLLVGYPPGSLADTTARRVVKDISDNGGPAIIVDNKTGDSGKIAARAVATTKKTDAPKLLLVNNDIYINAYTLRSLNIDLTSDLKPVGYVGSLQTILLANKESNIKSIADLKNSSADIVKWGAASSTLQYYNMKNFQTQIKTTLEFIPYKGTILAMPDLIAGRITLVPEYYNSSKVYIDSNQVVPVAVSGHARLAGLPKVPTFEEQGISWPFEGAYYLFASGNLDDDSIKSINSALSQALTKNTNNYKKAGIFVDLNKNNSIVSFNLANIHKYQNYKLPSETLPNEKP